MRLLSLLFLPLALAQAPSKDTKPVRLPHYQEIIRAQMKCDKEMWARFHWDPEREAVLAPKAWSVIANLQISERTPSKEKHGGVPYRGFTVRFRGLVYFECGEAAQGLDAPSGKAMHILPVLLPAWKKPQFLDESGDDDPSTEVEGWPNFLSNYRTTDLEVPADTMGHTCLADVKDVLRDPHVIDLDKLCAGETAEKRKFTRKEIEKAVELWRKREKVTR